MGGTIFAISLILSNLINYITWEIHGVSEESQDEMGQQITYKSFKIAYFVLVVVMFLILIFSEGFSMGANLDGVKTSLCSSQFALPSLFILLSNS